MQLAIVGSTKFENDKESTEWATDIIEAYLTGLEVEIVISGGAVGIDSLARKIAEDFRLQVIEYLPEFKRWEPAGYKARNILIADSCDALLCIRHFASITYGSGWTADYAENSGKKVYRETWTKDI